MAFFNFDKSNLYIFIMVSVFILLGCGSGNTTTESITNPETTPEPVTNPETLAESLDRLGVDTEITPRLDSQGNPYPDVYAPLGNILTVRQLDPVDANVSTEPTYVVGRPEELFLGGLRLENSEAIFSVLDDISLVGKSKSEALLTTPVILEGRTIDEVPWAVDSNSTNRGEAPAGTRRDTAAMDSNGNGFLDAVTVYAVANDAGYDELYMQISDGNNATKVPDLQLFSSSNLLPIYDLRVTAADFDGDGRDELAVALARASSPDNFNTPVELYIFDDAYSDYVMLDEYTVNYTASFAEPSVTLSLTAFHADHDRQDELALVINESKVDINNADYASRLFIFDLIGSGLQQQTAGPITAEVRDNDGVPRNATAVRASVTAGDLDGDGLDELITGGFEEIVENCREYVDDFGMTYVNPIKYTLFAYGGHYNDFAAVRAGTMEVYPPCNIESGSEPYVMRHVHLNVLDFDNDEDMDIQFNDLVLDTVPQRNWEKSVIAFLDDNRILYGDMQRTYFDRSDSVITVSDQTGDGVKDILSLSMYPNENDPYIRVYTWDANQSNHYRLATRIKINDLDYNNGNKNPILVAMDVNNDKITQLRYTGEHFMDITEPIVLAVIAAPPCKFDIGQDSCYTSWGNTLSGAVGSEHSVKVFGSAGSGAGTAGVGFLGEWLVKVSASASWIRSKSYELSKSQTFSTGPGEDGVIFTSVPLDRYLYKIIYNSTDGTGEVGDEVEIRLPRSPDIRIVERGYYNANITADAEPIDERVYQHIPGDIGSYPTASQKNTILERERSILEDARLVKFERTTNPNKYDIVEALGGLEVGPVLVGQGGGATELSLEYTETSGKANELTMGVSFEAEMLFGLAITWEVGVEFGRTMTISHGNSTLYSGSVDSIDEDFYADNVYGFGLFTYLQSLGDREIEVINYWVEE